MTSLGDNSELFANGELYRRTLHLLFRVKVADPSGASYQAVNVLLFKLAYINSNFRLLLDW